MKHTVEFEFSCGDEVKTNQGNPGVVKACCEDGIAHLYFIQTPGKTGDTTVANWYEVAHLTLIENPL